jgi:hypothetical protein
MTIRVDLTELTATLADFDYAYLLTVNDEGRAHAVAVTPDLTDGAFRVHELGRKSVANAAARPQLSLVYPPREPGGYSLIVDGDATADGDTVSITPTTAVLHRPAPAGFQPDAGACGSDCQPISLGTS